MPEMSYPISDSDQDHLLFDAPPRGIWKQWICKRKTIFALISVLTIMAILCTLVLSLTLPKSAVIIPSTLAPYTTTSIPSTTPTPTNLTTTTTPSTTPQTTPTTPTTPTTTPTTSPTTTTKPTTTTVPTTEKTTTVDPKTTTTFHPTTLKPLPTNATDYPPVSLLHDMGMRPNFTLILCKLHAKPTFKFSVTVLDIHTYIGEDQDRKEDAKTSSARVANEALFGIHYPKPMPNATFPCLV